MEERMHYKTLWGIKKYDSDEYEREAKPLLQIASEQLILAQWHINNGARRLGEAAFNKLVGPYLRKAQDFMERGERFAFESVVIEDNLLLNEGINNIWTLICGGSATAYNNANARLGVGDDNTAAAATQTGLVAATNKLYVAMDGGFPTYGTSQQAVFKSTFGSAQANYAWNEFCVDNGAAAGLDINRKVSAQGTKASGQSWALTLTITFS